MAEVRMSIKVPEPETFDGNRKNAERWLFTLRKYFNANNLSNEEHNQ